MLTVIIVALWAYADPNATLPWWLIVVLTLSFVISLVRTGIVLDDVLD